MPPDDGQIRTRAPLLALALLLALIAAASPAAAKTRSSSRQRPRISLAAPGEVFVASNVTVSGAVSRAPRGARVILEGKMTGRWRTLASAEPRRGKFSLGFRAPSSAGPLPLRAELRRGRRRLARSSLRLVKLRVRPSTALPLSATSADRPPAPSAEILARAAQQVLSVGSQAEVVLPRPLSSIEAIEGPVEGAGPGVSIAGEGGALSVSASVDAAPGEMTLSVRGSGCNEEGCEKSFLLAVPLQVVGVKAPADELETLPTPSDDRLAQAVDHQMRDELLITVGSPEAPGTREDAEAAATGAGGVVSGGLEESGIFQVRWAQPEDLEDRSEQLEAESTVTSVAPATVGLYGDTSSLPIASAYDQARWTWPYTQVHAAQAWEVSTGSDVAVGILDSGSVYSRHEDLNVRADLDGYSPAFHATHVAGLACAKPNQLGLVGMAQGCPVVSAHWSGKFTPGVLEAMHELASRGDVEVVNASLGLNANGCADQHEQEEVLDIVRREKGPFTQFLAGPEGRRIVWTFSAGNNCAPGPASPWGANSQLQNVITVAATNSDSSLASFSNFGPGVEVAAPGGVSVSPQTDGILSTSTDFDCPIFDRCSTGPIGIARGAACHTFFVNCSTYLEDRGTSMAAPQVAGIAALVRGAHPDLSANQSGACITSTAGTGGTGNTEGQSDMPPGYSPSFSYFGSTPIVNARAAIDCVARSTASSYAGSGGGDGWAVALTQNAVFNVFHHNTALEVACHFQSDATPCWQPERITDANESDFASSGQPGLWLDQSTERLYVFATRRSDLSAGVVCIDLAEAFTDPDPFCGFTALTSAAESESGISSLSAPALVGSRWFAFNYVSGAEAEGGRNKLLCFDLHSFSPCSGQPFAVGAGAGEYQSTSYPPPALTALGSRVIVPVQVGGQTWLACFQGNTETPCAGSWPAPVEGYYQSNYGAAFPLLTQTGALSGFCLPMPSLPCYDLLGAPASAPAGLSEAVDENSGWDGSALVIGTRVYVPNGDFNQVDCYDYAAQAPCENFPAPLEGLYLLYTVNADPERPRCIWVNSDNGNAQIQNFDAFTAGHCE